MNSVQAFSAISFIILYFSVSYLFGETLLSVLKVKSNLALSVSTGIILIFAENEIVSLPFMLTRGVYQILLYMQVIILIFSILTCLLYLIKKKRDFLNCINLKELSNPLVVTILIIVIIQTIVPAAFARFDGDDAFYIAVSTSIDSTGRIFLNNPSIGLDKFIFPANYQFTAYEILITIFSTLTDFDPVVFYHTILPIVYIPTYYVCFLALGKTLFKKKEEAYTFVLVISLLTLFDAYSNYLPSSFLLLKSWMGKGCTINFCATLLIIFFIKIIRSEGNLEYPYKNYAYYVLIAITLIAGVGTSAVGLYLLPLYYFIFALTLLLSLTWKKHWLMTRVHFAVKAFLSALPVALILVAFYVSARANSGLTLLNSFESHRTWLQDASLLFQDNLTSMTVYGLSLLYFLFFGNREERIIFISMPLVLLFTFLNPFLHEFIGRYLTSLPLYWRMFWLMPVFITIASCITDVLFSEALKKTQWRAVILLLLLVITIPQNFALTDEKYYQVENSAKIPNDISAVVEKIEENVNTTDINKLYLLALPKYNIYLRQYTGNIALVMPRYNFVEEAYKLAGERRNFRRIVKLFRFDATQTIRGYVGKFDKDDLKELGITLIITPTTREELDQDFVRLGLDNNEYLYIRRDIYKSDKK